MTSVNANVFSYFSFFYFFTFFLFPHLPHLRLAKHAMTAKNADKHAQIENILNHSIPWDVIKKKVGCGKSMIRRISRKTKLQSKNSAGRHRLLTPREETKAARDIRLGLSKSAADASFGVKKPDQMVNPKTIARTLKRKGLKSTKKKTVLPLNNDKQKARYDWAKAHKDWSETDWERVVFSDETKIQKRGSNGLEYAWKDDNAPYRDHHYKKKHAYGGGGIMLWSCITIHGGGYMSWLQSNVNGELYTSVLEEEYKETLKYYGLQSKDMIFQQDNASIHCASAPSKWFQKNKIKLLSWPAYSPDLNPIENAWAMLKKKEQMTRPPSSVVETDQAFFDRVSKLWYDLATPEYCRNLIHSMPRRVRDVIQRKGRDTKY